MKSIFFIFFTIIIFIFNISCANVNQTSTTGETRVVYSNNCSSDGDCNTNEICYQSYYICKNKVTGKINPKHKKLEFSKAQVSSSSGISNQTIIIIVFSSIVLIAALIFGLNGQVTQCCDGTTSSSTGSGTCSHHGGVC